MIHVMASIVVHPPHAAAAKALLIELAEASRKEAGCLSYELFQRPDLPHVFQTVESWRAAEDADAHMKTAHVGAAIAAAGSMFAAPPQIVFFAKIG
ncbi:MAG: putative quinol monooxygenase [Caldimonas sp.]